MENSNKNQEHQCNIITDANCIISDLELKIYKLSFKYNDITVSEFKNLPEVKEIMTTILVLEKYYR